jgi:hypothetical protein
MKDPTAALTKMTLTTILVTYLQIPEKLAHVLHAAVQRDRQHPFARALLYALRRPWTSENLEASALACMNGCLQPRRMCEYLESLCTRGLLSRAESNTLMEAWLRRADATGDWQEK